MRSLCDVFLPYVLSMTIDAIYIYSIVFFYTSVVINSVSLGEAMIFTATCWLPAKINHSHILDATSCCFSASESQKVFSNDEIDEVDCLSSNWNDALETIGFP